MKAEDIPIVANRQWDIWINQSLVTPTGIQLPGRLQQRAKLYNEP
jgi:hypothetical protein